MSVKFRPHYVATAFGLCLLVGSFPASAQHDATQVAEQRIAELEARALRQLRGGERANAIRTFRQLLSLDPGHSLQSDYLTPAARGLFSRIQQPHEKASKQKG